MLCYVRRETDISSACSLLLLIPSLAYFSILKMDAMFLRNAVYFSRGNQHLGETYGFNFQKPTSSWFNLFFEREVIRSSETWMDYYQTTRHYSAEDRPFQSHWCENLVFKLH
jgi:hypothetical protein